MLSIIKKLRLAVDYLLDFVLDESEIMKLSRKKDLREFVKYLNKNFGKKLKKNLENFNHIFNYKHEEVQELIWQMKFNDNYPVAKIFGLALAKKIEEIILKEEKYILIPIPIHKRRRRERGYNQCEWLCENIIHHLKNNNLKIEYRKDILIRHVYKKKQSWQSDKKERMKSTKGIYKINEKSKITNQKIILIDDVYTTGATIKEAADTLESQKVREILILTIAH